MRTGRSCDFHLSVALCSSRSKAAFEPAPPKLLSIARRGSFFVQAKKARETSSSGRGFTVTYVTLDVADHQRLAFGVIISEDSLETRDSSNERPQPECLFHELRQR